LALALSKLTIDSRFPLYLPCSPGNGVMVALQVDSKTKVDALCQKALALGTKDEGAAGRAVPGSTPTASANSAATS